MMAIPYLKGVGVVECLHWMRCKHALGLKGTRNFLEAEINLFVSRSGDFMKIEGSFEKGDAKYGVRAKRGKHWRPFNKYLNCNSLDWSTG